ncbi:MAG: hypothetical protein OXP12_08145 [Thaumarchaeota archaeon]|nr:hypothetical protein [Nitrososphaerota archaeon]MDE0266873.1 hypothetical protein [Nitrososphaerota archaeon]MDE0525748.1 hypothetical protein [Nitrososphaerota archaeon]
MTLEFTYHAANGEHATRREDADMVIFKDVDVSDKMVMWNFKGGPKPDFLPDKISNPGEIDLTMEELEEIRKRDNISVMVLDVDVESGSVTPRDGTD